MLALMLPLLELLPLPGAILVGRGVGLNDGLLVGSAVGLL